MSGTIEIQLEKNKLFRAYRKWCDENHKKPMEWNSMYMYISFINTRYLHSAMTPESVDKIISYLASEVKER